MAPLRILVVDDEAPARKKIIHFLEGDREVTVVGQAGNGPDAVAAIQETRPDLLFLDVQMPGMDGFEVVRALEPGPMPRIVFVTAHDEYAIQAFDVHAFGYLLKPFDQTRFLKVLDDAKKELARDDESKAAADLKKLLAEVQRRQQRPARLLIQQNQRAFFVPAERIDWVESDRNYIKIHVGDQAYSIRGTLDSLEERLDPEQFLRLNRGCLVRIDFIRELQNWFHGEYKVILNSGVIHTWTRRYLNRHPELQKM